MQLNVLLLALTVALLVAQAHQQTCNKPASSTSIYYREFKEAPKQVFLATTSAILMPRTSYLLLYFAPPQLRKYVSVATAKELAASKLSIAPLPAIPPMEALYGYLPFVGLEIMEMIANNEDLEKHLPKDIQQIRNNLKQLREDIQWPMILVPEAVLVYKAFQNLNLMQAVFFAAAVLAVNLATISLVWKVIRQGSVFHAFKSLLILYKMSIALTWVAVQFFPTSILYWVNYCNVTIISLVFIYSVKLIMNLFKSPAQPAEQEDLSKKTQ